MKNCRPAAVCTLETNTWQRNETRGLIKVPFEATKLWAQVPGWGRRSSRQPNFRTSDILTTKVHTNVSFYSSIFKLFLPGLHALTQILMHCLVLYLVSVDGVLLLQLALSEGLVLLLKLLQLFSWNLKPHKNIFFMPSFYPNLLENDDIGGSFL